MMIMRFFVSAVLIWLVPFTAFASSTIGMVAYVKGTVMIERGADNIVAALKTPLVQGDTVTTQEKAAVKLLFKDDSVITLGPGSKLVMTEYLYNNEQQRAKSILSLLVGKLRAAVNRATLEVRTKSAVAGVRGTLFYLSQEAGKADIAVLEGTVVAGRYVPDGTTPGEEILLQPGQAISIIDGQPLQQPVEISASSAAAVIAALEALHAESLQDLDLKALEDQIKIEEQKLEEEGQPKPPDIPLLPPINQVPRNTTPVNIPIIFPAP